MLGIHPDYVIKVRKDVLEEEDGTMLIHGLQNLNHKRIILPMQAQLAPDAALLERRYLEFRGASSGFNSEL